MVFAYVNFFIFIALLFYFAKNPLKKQILQRQEEFARALAKAKAMEQESKEKMIEIASELKDIENKMLQLDMEVKKRAEIENALLNKQAERVASEMVVSAENLIGQEIAEATRKIVEALTNKIETKISDHYLNKTAANDKTAEIDKEIAFLADAKLEKVG